MEKSSNSWIIHDSLYKTFCYADTWVIQHRSFGGSSVMVRWGIPERGRTPLVVDGNLTGLRCEIVQRYVIPFIQAQANNVPFQHESARSHVARVVRDCLTQQNVDGQQFHPIFHPLSIWDEMERQLRHLQNQPLTLSEIGPALIRIWNKIPQEGFSTLIRSMHHRCKACMINANGGHIRYWLC